MQAISVNPSVASLTDNRVQAHAESKGDQQLSLGIDSRYPQLQSAVTGAAPRILVHALRRAMDESVSMQMARQITTPRGPVQADLILESESRRVALLVADQTRANEALLLVYGGFDAIYRVSAHDATWNVTAVGALLEAAEPELFGHEGAAQLAALSSVRKIVTGRTTLQAQGWNGSPCGVLHRRRINRHGDWVATFEALVDQQEDRRRAS